MTTVYLTGAAGAVCPDRFADAGALLRFADDRFKSLESRLWICVHDPG